MIRINQIKIDIDKAHNNEEAALTKTILRELRIRPELLFSYNIVKKSIDARKDEVKYVYCIDACVDNEKKVLEKVRNKNISLASKKTYKYQVIGDEHLNNPPIVVGSGPAGLFCTYMLAKEGYKPILIERGSQVEERIEKVSDFWNTGKLDTECNVQFGEGGAGTFSDGKLNTLVKDKLGRQKEILKIFVDHGAPEEIMYVNKPHIGTDKLVNVVKSMRNSILKMGGKVFFNTKLTNFDIQNGKIKAIEINNNEWIPTDVVVLAIGHSARDTFRILKDKEFDLSKKSFAVGVRMEHPQEMISKKMYGEAYAKLPAAPYKVTHQSDNGRAVYSFCMCPGGFVVNASSENNRLVVNGMSNYNRDELNANSAIIVNVTPEDFGSDDVLAGIEFQQELEEAAYREGQGKVPVQLYGDFKDKRKSVSIGSIKPNIKGEYKLANLHNVLPDYVAETIIDGVEAFDKKINGFAREDAVMSGIESRTSSPIRIERDELFESNIKGVYPCGEGAGYAGGITSAAIDGLKVFEAIVGKYSNK
ncbi:MAG: FAD-dependent oxidoreductase [Lachnospiraceae bacterium]|nr:FAD-dependent oxidoreductase [Lachnospiraceae bacterium]